ncbi:MAG: NAD(+)/NADH kinase [Eubacterium sp.]|nr:NAD(+)/NADH kinase [Eubacterium sp.]
MKKCRRFLIIANETKDIDLKWSKHIEALIKSRLDIDDSLAAAQLPDEKENESEGKAYFCLVSGSNVDALIEKLEVEFERVDVVIVMGGDGTMLRVSHALGGRDIPVIGVNLGTVGFLTEVAVENIDSMVDRLISGDYEIEERMMLDGHIVKQKADRPLTKNSDGFASSEKQGKDICLRALNEVVFARENNLRLIAVKIFVNGRYFDTCEADGILVATPTGSTGYNLSAGGPIVKPDARLMVLTPISPFSLSRRSVIFGADDKITMELLEKRQDAPNTAMVTSDGADNISMTVGDRVEIEVSDSKLSLIRLTHTGMFDNLRRKLER